MFIKKSGMDIIVFLDIGVIVLFIFERLLKKLKGLNIWFFIGIILIIVYFIKFIEVVVVVVNFLLRDVNCGLIVKFNLIYLE